MSSVCLPKIRVWGRLGRIDKVNYTLNVTPSILNYLQTELDMPFTIDKLGKYLDLLSTLLYRLETYSLIKSLEALLMFPKVLYCREKYERFSTKINSQLSCGK